MARRGRYTTLDNWYLVERIEAPAWARFHDSPTPTFTIEGCDVREEGGRIWHDGGRRVSVKPKVPGFRAKTFIGEMAWCDAERYANDAALRVAQND